MFTFMFWIFFDLELYLVEIIYVLDPSYGWWHGFCWDVFDFRCDYYVETYSCMITWWLFVDVTTISYLFI